MRGATIPGRLNLNGASLSNRGGVALRAGSCTIGELWLENAAPITGLVTLHRSRIDLIHAPHEVWPAHVRLDGLSYDGLTPRLPAAQRLKLL